MKKLLIPFILLLLSHAGHSQFIRHLTEGDSTTSYTTPTRLRDTAIVLNGLIAQRQRMLGWVDARDYGGIPGDGTDDYTALQAAADATPARGTLYLAPGLWRTAQTITRSNTQGPINIVGAAGEYGGSVLRMTAANTTCISITVQESAVLSEQDNACSIKYLRIEGPTGNTTGDGIFSEVSTHTDFVSIYGFYNGYRQGNGGYYGHFYRTMFQGATNAGFHGTQNLNFNYEFNTCRFESCAYGAYIVNSGTDGERVSFKGCEVERNSSSGLYIDGFNAVLIGDTYFESNVDNVDNITLGANYQCQSVQITGCWFTNYPSKTQRHINLNKVNGITIQGTSLSKWKTENTALGITDIQGTANTTGVTLIGTLYQIVSLPNGFNVIADGTAKFSGLGDGAGNAVGVVASNTYGGSTTGYGVTVDNAYGKGLNFSEQGVADGRLFIQKTTGNVGVNTTNPAQKLTVVGFTDNAAVGPLLIKAQSQGTQIGVATTLDATPFTGGHSYSYLSTGPHAGVGAGKFVVYDGTADANRLVIGTDGSLRIPALGGTTTRVPAVDGNGVFGSIPNGTDGQVLKIVSGAPAFADNTASTPTLSQVLTAGNDATDKTFNGVKYINAKGVFLSDTDYPNTAASFRPAYLLIQDNSTGDKIEHGTDHVSWIKTGGQINVTAPTATATRTISWPDKSGTVAMVGDINVGTLALVNDANYSIAAGVSEVKYTHQSASRSITLPAASANTGRRIRIMSTNSYAFGLTFSVNVKTDDVTSVGGIGQNESMLIMSDGTDWWQVGK